MTQTNKETPVVQTVDFEDIGILARIWRGRIWYGTEWYITVFGGLILFTMITMTIFAPVIAP